MTDTTTGVDVLPDLRAAVPAGGRGRRRRRGGRPPPRPRPSGLGRLRLPQGHGVRSTSTTIPTGSTTRCGGPTRRPSRIGEFERGVVGRRVRRHRRAVARHPAPSTGPRRSAATGATRSRTRRAASRPCTPSGGRCSRPGCSVGYAGPLQQVRRDGRDVRRRGDVPCIPTSTTPTTSCAWGATRAGATSPRSRCPTPSRPSAASVERGGDVTFVNPRRIRAVELGLGDHLQIKPDTDALPARRAARLRSTGSAGGTTMCWPGTGATSTTCAVHRAVRRRLGGLVTGSTPTTSGARRGPSPRRRRRSRTWAPAATWAARARSSTGCCRCPQPGHRQPRVARWRAPAGTAADRTVRRAPGSVLRLAGGSGAPRLGPCARQPARRLHHRAEPSPLRALIVIGGNPIMADPRRGAAPRGLPAPRARRHHGPLPQRHGRALGLRAPGERLAGAGRLPEWRCRHPRRPRSTPTRSCAPAARAQGGVVDPGPHRAGARSAVGPRR